MQSLAKMEFGIENHILDSLPISSRSVKVVIESVKPAHRDVAIIVKFGRIHKFRPCASISL